MTFLGWFLSGVGAMFIAMSMSNTLSKKQITKLEALIFAVCVLLGPIAFAIIFLALIGKIMIEIDSNGNDVLFDWSNPTNTRKHHD